jgi:hypothetical protein
MLTFAERGPSYCRCLLAHFGGLLPPTSTPVSAPAPTAVQVGPTASEVAESRRAQPTPPVAAAPVNNTDAPVAQPALKPVKDAKALPPRKRTKTDTSVSEKELARNRRKPWLGPHSPMSTPIGRHRLTR